VITKYNKNERQNIQHKYRQLFPVSEVDTEPYLHYIDIMKLKINKIEKNEFGTGCACSGKLYQLCDLCSTWMIYWNGATYKCKVH
jgi:hypothetical protein